MYHNLSGERTHPTGTVRFASLIEKRTRLIFFARLLASYQRIQLGLAWSLIFVPSRLAESEVRAAKIRIASLKANPSHFKKLLLVSLRF